MRGEEDWRATLVQGVVIRLYVLWEKLSEKGSKASSSPSSSYQHLQMYTIVQPAQHKCDCRILPSYTFLFLIGSIFAPVPVRTK